MRKIRVLIYEPYPFGKIAGNLKTQSYIIDKIDRDFFSLVLMAPFETEFTALVRGKGIETIVLEPSQRVNRYGGRCLRDNYWSKFLTLYDLASYNLKVSRVLREQAIDLVYCNGIRSLLTVGPAAKLNGIPIFWYVKGELQNPVLDRLGFLMASKIAFFCETNKNDKYDYLTFFFRKKIDVLKLGLDLEEIESIDKKPKFHLAAELDIRPDRVNCAYLGQLYAPKGVHDLIEAFSVVRKDFPQAHLYVVGDHIIEEYEKYRSRLYKMVVDLGLDDVVTFTGWREDALQILSLMDILIHPSFSEGGPRIVLEAMAFGKAVVATRVGVVREVIKDGLNGFLIDPGKPAAIAEKLTLLLKSKALRMEMGRRARETIWSEYNVEERIKELGNIWLDMTKKG
ncbi:MAG TPA: glycosyltransferase [Syntrophales bacterium]|nr:glycosyltransferase [Syntrophales bacterium]